ncbi:MAG: ATP-binding cassette domain-containing protein [Candidatus Rokubacteria bacterium]|nr:ATP-binding cassette domain-containing protein [Candidatus Rokubacteria bacterium]
MTLAVEGLSVRFGATAALSGVGLSLDAPVLLGLVGPNGAGKTTLLDAIGGLVRPEAGRIHLDGVELTALPPDAVARLGVARTFQSPRIFTRMTVEENVRAGRSVDPGPWLAATGLDRRRHELAAALGPAEAGRLELARALAGEPHLLLLDEPCGGLNATETEAMVTLLQRAAAPGRAVILVEHKLGVIGRLCKRVAVLHLGEKIFDGPSGGLHTDPRVLEAYLGGRRAP